MLSPLDNYLAALSQIESGGDYNALGPKMPSGDRAYGKYQVMGSNIPAWTQIATGNKMTPQQFLQDQDAQEAVARKLFGGYVDQYGPRGAAAKWFSGKPDVNSTASDGSNTVPQYVAKFDRALAAQGGALPAVASAYANADNAPSPGAAPATIANPLSNIPAAALAAVQAKAPTAGGWPNTGPDVASDPLVPQSTPLGAAGTPGSPVAGPPGPPAPPGPPVGPNLPWWVQTAQQQIPQAQASGSPMNIVPPGAGGSADAGDAKPPPVQVAQNGTSDATPVWAKAAGAFAPSLQQAGAYLMGISNPSGGAAMLDAANKAALARLEMMKPQWVKTGQDIYNQETYGAWYPYSGKPPTPMSGAGSSTGSAMDPVSAALGTGKTGEDLLSEPGIPDAVKSVVRGVSGGAQPYNPTTMMRTGMGRAALALLDQYEPGTTPAEYAGREAGMKDWATKSAELTRRANNAALHGSDLPDSFQALGNYQSPAWNAVRNGWNTYITGKGAPVGAGLNITAFANELGALARGNGGSDSATKEWEQGFPVNGSPDQQRTAMGKGADLFSQMVDNLEQKRLQAVGPVNAAKMGPIVPQNVRDAIQKMRDYANQEGKYAPQGQTPAPAAAPSGVVDYRTYFGAQ